MPKQTRRSSDGESISRIRVHGSCSTGSGSTLSRGSSCNAGRRIVFILVEITLSRKESESRENKYDIPCPSAPPADLHVWSCFLHIQLKLPVAAESRSMVAWGNSACA